MNTINSIQMTIPEDWTLYNIGLTVAVLVGSLAWVTLGMLVFHGRKS